MVLALAGDRSRAVTVLQADMTAARAEQSIAQFASLAALPMETRAAAILGFERRAPAIARADPAPVPAGGSDSSSAPAVPKGWIVQAGAFKSEKIAQEVAAKLAASGMTFNVSIGGTGLYHVRSAPLPSWDAARDLARRLQRGQVEDAFVAPAPQS
jgi:cell division protein FtsN